MSIRHFGHAIVESPFTKLHLKTFLHVLSATKNLSPFIVLLKTTMFFLSFPPWYFYVKDQTAKKVLLKGPCKKGIYPLVSSSSVKNKQVFSVIKPPASRCHGHLGHPSFQIVQKIIRKYELPCSNKLSIESICDSCQHTKNNQLPYVRSRSIHRPRQLMFSDVWGPTPSSVGRYT
jgi:hypothetical protein